MAPSKRKNPPIEAILVDCALAAGRGVGKKRISLAAAKFWAAGYKASIREALHNGGVWSRDREVVLLAGVKLGRVAKKLAGTKKEISRAHAKKASEIISFDPICPPGSGRYCPPGGV